MSHHLNYTCTLIVFPVIIGDTIFKSIIVITQNHNYQYLLNKASTITY